MSGSQSMKVIWIVLPFLRECDHTAASRRMKKARENYVVCQQAISSKVSRCASLGGEFEARHEAQPSPPS